MPKIPEDGAEMPSSGYNLILTSHARRQMQRAGISLVQVQSVLQDPDAVLDDARETQMYVRRAHAAGVTLRAYRLPMDGSWVVCAVWPLSSYLHSASLWLKIVRLPYKLLGRVLTGAD